MAKKKVVKKVKEESVNNITVGEIKEPEVIETIADSTESLKTPPVIELKEAPIVEAEFEEVIGVNSAEQLQKSGRQLISVSTINGQRVYKFKR